MSIILAIEPDRRRAAQLTGMARAHLRAELLVAPTASQAVEALDGRVPDVLLTAPLLPSHEEAAMAEYLRQLGSAAAHVQTLTIPLLASGAGERDRPVLTAFLRERITRSEPEGCDPAVFAEQITEYLREAQERREAPAPSLSRSAAASAGDAQGPRLATRNTTSSLLARLLAAVVEEEQDDFRESALMPASKSALPAPVDEVRNDALEATIVDAGDVVPDIRLLRSSKTFTSDDDIPTYEPDLTAADDTDRRHVDDRSPVTSVKLITLTVGDDDAMEATDSPAPSVNAPAAIVAPQMRRRARRAQPVHDEWGFFDPNQCGFPALIAKLDEIASRESDS